MSTTLFTKIKLYTGAYVTIFALAAFCLLCFHERQADSPNLNDNSWKEGLHTNRTLIRDSDPLSLTYAGLRWTSNVFNCSVISEIKNVAVVGEGWTKTVYKGQWRSKTVAIKTVNFHGNDVVKCRHKGFPFVSCYVKAATKILREVALLTELQHNNFIKVLRTCIQEWKGILMEEGVPKVTVVTEFGERIDTLRLLQMSFAERLKLALDVAEILYHLAHSPLGSLAMSDFRMEQFVLVDQTLKLSDVDDVTVHNCHYQANMAAEAEETLMIMSRLGQRGYNNEEFLNIQDIFHSNKNVPNTSHNMMPTSKLKQIKDCQKMQDQQHERHNIKKAGILFINDILIHGCPSKIRNETEELMLAYSSLANWNTSKILHFTRNLYQIYKQIYNETNDWLTLF